MLPLVCDFCLTHLTYQIMKPAVWVFFLLFMTSTLHAERVSPKSLPQDIFDKFSLLYPDAKQQIWKLKDDVYTVQFRNHRSKTRAIFSKNGTLLATATQIRVIALPSKATAFIKKELGTQKIYEASILEDEEGLITFEAETSAGDVRFTGEGEFISFKEF